MKFGIGQSVLRREDPRLLTGQGRYTSDLYFDDQAYAFVLRSPYAHAVINSIDTSAAKSADGVLGVWTIEDVEAAGLNPIPCLAAGMVQNRDGSAITAPAYRPLLAKERVRHVGDSVALIVAETLAQAKDAADLIDIDYDDRPVVTSAADALAEDAPLVFQEHGTNLVFDWAVGDEEAQKKAFDEAAHVVKLNLINNRVVVNSMEPRAATGLYDKAKDHYTLYAGTQGVHLAQNVMANMVLGIKPEQLRIVTGDVGGGFGMKMFLFGEYPLVLFAAKALNRPVKWVGERTDAFITDTQGRDHITEAALALDKDGKFLGVKVDTLANMGGYLSQFAPFIPTLAAAGMHVGAYEMGAYYNHVRGVLTHTTPVDAYRGAGRPEASYVIERLVDAAARELKIAPDVLREKNFVPPERMGKTSDPVLPFDSGNFSQVMNDATKRADLKGFEKRRTEAPDGFLRGLGIAYYVERTPGNSDEYARIMVDKDATAHVYAGTQSTGQGHETAWAQIVTEKLGIHPDHIVVHSGDTETLPGGGGTGGSRSLYMANGAIDVASEELITKGREEAAKMLGVEPDQTSFRAGDASADDPPSFFATGSNRVITLTDLAKQTPLDAQGVFHSDHGTFPNGCHICEVEVEKTTGMIRIVRYTVADDFGKILNPLIVAGQVHGGIVQGLGQARGEEAVFDKDTGQLLSGSFMDYHMPRADEITHFDLNFHEIPCGNTPIGSKGCGEVGTIGACPAFVNAVVDALAPLGVKHVDMPLTPKKIWHVIREHD